MRNIQKINISKLHGYKNYNIKIKDNKLILVGENGSGKTTILRMLFYLLSKQWENLAAIDFVEISVDIDGASIKFNKQEFLENRKKLDALPLPSRVKAMILEDPDGFRRYYGSRRFLYDESVIKEVMDNKYIKTVENILSKLNLRVLYLPTYRRIEQETAYIFNDLEHREEFAFRSSRYERHVNPDDNFIEQIEFGMNDVAKAIENKISSIKEYSRNSLNELSMGYLGDVIDKEYNNFDLNIIKCIEDEKIKSVLDRIDEKILPKGRKNRIEKTIHNVRDGGVASVEDKVVCYYFNKLLNFNSELEAKEKELQTFCDVCNSYFYNKQIVYSKDISVDVVTRNKETDTSEEKSLGKTLNTLSSGEKQIVSIFSRLYLREENKEYQFFVLIDEPELSLSVPWQKKLISDMEKGTCCGGIIAVTHSPFIFDSPMVDMYAHSLEEFKK